MITQVLSNNFFFQNIQTQSPKFIHTPTHPRTNSERLAQSTDIKQIHTNSATKIEKMKTLNIKTTDAPPSGNLIKQLPLVQVTFNDFVVRNHACIFFNWLLIILLVLR
jgi:hypothetical protein